LVVLEPNMTVLAQNMAVLVVLAKMLAPDMFVLVSAELVVPEPNRSVLVPNMSAQALGKVRMQEALWVLLVQVYMLMLAFAQGLVAPEPNKSVLVPHMSALVPAVGLVQLLGRV
jgi:hypothetical protein